MRIVIDGRMMLAGQGTYTSNLLEQLQILDKSNEYIVLLRRDGMQKVSLTAPNFKKQLADYGQYSFKEQLFLPVLLYRLRADLVHFVSYNLPLLYLKKYVVTVHDLTLVNFKMKRPGTFGWAYEAKYWAGRMALKWAVHFARHIIVPSEFVRSQVCQQLRVRESRVTVTHEAAEPSPHIASTFAHAPQKPFLLSVSSPYPHKNFKCLIKAFSIIHKNIPELILVIAGGTAASQAFLDDLKRVAASEGLKESVIFTGYVKGQELAWLYQNAELFVFPSLSEGFGLPGLEAMQAGTPVVAANATCLPEVYGEAAVYFDPLDPGDLAAKVTALVGRPEELAAMRQAGLVKVKEYSWMKLAQITLRVYESVLK
jgi:glycosyltransferase involved in cell wall biosynthesis